MDRLVASLQGGLIVSCQADPGDPLYGVEHMVALARAARVGGAAAIRANGPLDVRAIKEAVPLPVIGIVKRRYEGSPVFITPTMDEVRAVAAAGADLVAVDLTDQPRPDSLSRRAFVAQIRAEFPGLPVMADISTLAEGLAAAEWGADLVSTTLSGYTPYSPQQREPDLGLVEALAQRTRVPVVAEGRISSPQEARRAMEFGAFAVVVGTAITRPQTVTAWYVEALRGAGG